MHWALNLAVNANSVPDLPKLPHGRQAEAGGLIPPSAQGRAGGLRRPVLPSWGHPGASGLVAISSTHRWGSHPGWGWMLRLEAAGAGQRG